MRITILATGSRGDVQPSFALAYALQCAGHAVTVVSNTLFQPMLAAYGFDFRPVDWDPLASIHRQTNLEKTQWSHTPLADLRAARQATHEIFTVAQRDSWSGCQDAECLVYSVLSPWGFSIGEKLGIPALPTALHPLTPTRAFPMQLILRDLGGPLNYATHLLAEVALDLATGGELNIFRQETLGLPPIKFPNSTLGRLRRQGTPLLYNLSPTVVPRPADWPPFIHQHGYWRLPPPPGWQPAADLLSFLESGPPPVYIGFGSMVKQGATRLAQVVMQALTIAGLRGVLSRGWGGLQVDTALPETVHLIDDVPHEWLFPRCAVVMHHAGMGTTAAGLLAGIPAVTLPHMQDQPYWAKRLCDLGVAPPPLSEKTLTPERLALALQEAHLPERVSRAQELGARLRQEDGLGLIVGQIEVLFDAARDRKDG